jgi:coronin-1B/1C/6
MRLSTVTGDQQYVKASAKYFVVALQGGGGPMCVGRLDRPGRFEGGTSALVQGHTGSVLDVDFNPFDDTMFASASEDTTIKLWSIPDDWEPTAENGMAKKGENLTESLVDLTGHKKKVTLLRYHPTASNIILSTGADYTVKTWDIEKGEAITSFDDMPDLTQDLVWDFRGDNYATSCKDKTVRLYDARTSSVTSKIDLAHEGSKSTKLAYLGDSGKILSTGASKTSSREVKIWDLKNLSKPICSETIDTASGALIPLYDNDTKVLYLCGKGDGQLRIFEFEDKEPYLHKLNDGYRSTRSTKGMCMIPKRGVDVMQHETVRLLKLTNNQGIHPLSFCVPRKSDAFQDDIFPECPAPVAAHTGEAWFAGSSKAPVTMSLDPASRGGQTTKKKMFKSVSQLNKDLEEATNRIEFLEQKLKENGITVD